MGMAQDGSESDVSMGVKSLGPASLQQCEESTKEGSMLVCNSKEQSGGRCVQFASIVEEIPLHEDPHAIAAHARELEELPSAGQRIYSHRRERSVSAWAPQRSALELAAEVRDQLA